MSESVLYMKLDKNDGDEIESIEEDIWDDTALIKAYDKAILMAKEKICKEHGYENGNEHKGAVSGINEPMISVNGTQNSNSKKKSTKRERSKNNTQWKVGMYCRAVYSEDCQEYEAVITTLGDRCTVKFIGYENEDAVSFETIKPSRGLEARIQQQIQARNSTQSQGDGAMPYHSSQVGMLPPPPPPFVTANLPKDETDALSAMLMSWYMSGYHTGYYQGLTRSKPKPMRNHHP